MRIVLIVLLVLIISLSISFSVVQILQNSKPTVQTNDTPPVKTYWDDKLPRPRLEELYWQDLDNPDTNRANIKFRVFHDKETGQEILCIKESSTSLSCWPSGRNWK